MHYFSGKGCFEFLESMHYCIGILNKVLLVHDGKSTSFKPEQSYNFFRGKIMSKKKDVLFLLSAMKSHLNNSKIQKIELAK